MNGINQIMIVGRVGANPDLKFSENNTPYFHFDRMNEQWTKDGEEKNDYLVSGHRV
jgi:hypothetical protein